MPRAPSSRKKTLGTTSASSSQSPRSAALSSTCNYTSSSSPPRSWDPPTQLLDNNTNGHTKDDDIAELRSRHRDSLTRVAPESSFISRGSNEGSSDDTNCYSTTYSSSSSLESSLCWLQNTLFLLALVGLRKWSVLGLYITTCIAIWSSTFFYYHHRSSIVRPTGEPVVEWRRKHRDRHPEISGAEIGENLVSVGAFVFLILFQYATGFFTYSRFYRDFFGALIVGSGITVLIMRERLRRNLIRTHSHREIVVNDRSSEIKDTVLFARKVSSIIIGLFLWSFALRFLDMSVNDVEYWPHAALIFLIPASKIGILGGSVREEKQEGGEVVVVGEGGGMTTTSRTSLLLRFLLRRCILHFGGSTGSGGGATAAAARESVGDRRGTRSKQQQQQQQVEQQQNKKLLNVLISFMLIVLIGLGQGFMGPIFSTWIYSELGGSGEGIDDRDLMMTRKVPSSSSSSSFTNSKVVVDHEHHHHFGMDFYDHPFSTYSSVEDSVVGRGAQQQQSTPTPRSGQQQQHQHGTGWSIPWPWLTSQRDYGKSLRSLVHEINEREKGTLPDQSFSSSSSSSSCSSSNCNTSGIFFCVMPVVNKPARWLGGIHTLVVVEGRAWEAIPGVKTVQIPNTLWINGSSSRSFGGSRISLIEKLWNPVPNDVRAFDILDDPREIWHHCTKLPSNLLLLQRMVASQLRQAGAEKGEATGSEGREGEGSSKTEEIAPTWSTSTFSIAGRKETQQLHRWIDANVADFVDRLPYYTFVLRPSNCHNLVKDVLSLVSTGLNSVVTLTTPDATTRNIIIGALLFHLGWNWSSLMKLHQILLSSVTRLLLL